ncbi:homologous recombination OB-fold protein-like isoform X2 [Planococcus citri]|uniref:homologous recombination OB-fold protein-like isoform X2 n=1 Tax=Planococcus citri TaxID=170843 RepID=UPI0031F7A35E
MFKFTDDDDPDDEGFLDLPLDKSTCKGELNSTKCSEADNLKDILENCEEDDLILSMIDTVDTSTIDQSLPKQGSIEKYITTSNVKHKSTLADPCTSTLKAPRVEYERKFPGPAGLIPIKSKFTTPVKYQVLPEGSPKQADVAPGKNDFIFESGCWDELTKDVETMSPRLVSIIEENTVASVRKMNIICSKPRKLRFFAALIVNIDCSVCDPSIMLKDSTGEIHGTLHKELWETYSNLLTVGTALLMKQVSVSSITNSRKLYVNVTSNNIVKLYTPQTGAPVLVTEVASISQFDIAPQVKKNERLVFEETNPNIPPKPTREVPTRKPSSTNPVSKTTDHITQTTRKENKPLRTDNFKTKTDTLVRNVELSSNIPHRNEIVFDELNGLDDTLIRSVEISSNIQTQKEIVFDELNDIDADSLFGEF